MPVWEVAIWAERLTRTQAQRDLMALDIASYTSWSGDSGGDTPTWVREGNEARQRFRQALMRAAGYATDTNAGNEPGRVSFGELKQLFRSHGFAID